MPRPEAPTRPSWTIRRGMIRQITLIAILADVSALGSASVRHRIHAEHDTLIRSCFEPRVASAAKESQESGGRAGISNPLCQIPGRSMSFPLWSR